MPIYVYKHSAKSFRFIEDSSEHLFFVGISNFHAFFLVETDPSSCVLGAVLALREIDGKTRQIRYTGRTKTVAKRNYSACEREALVVILGLKNFRVNFLPSLSFELTTDHSHRHTRFSTTMA